MNEKDFKIRTKMIRETFNDKRKIISAINIKDFKLDEDIHQNGDFFLAEDGGIIYLEFQLIDFTEEELVKYVKLAENLYKKHPFKISIYIICPNEVNVYVNECEIKSKAEFTIKLTKINEDTSKIIMDEIRYKIENNIRLDNDDFKILKDLPAICDENERYECLLECLKLMNNRI